MNSLERDNDSRNRIVSDISANFFVEAGAGSGKTTMLVNRMVAMVEAGIDISKISAITFTKAAAGEFYERFQKLLIDRSNPEFKWENKGHAGQLPKPTEQTRERCARALQNIDLCFLGTIDSFCNMILSEHPSEAGILSDSSLITEVDYKQIYVRICNGEFGDELKSLANSFRAVHRNDQDVFSIGMDVFMNHRNVHFNYDEHAMADIDRDFAEIREELIRTVRCLVEHQYKIRDEGKQTSAEAWERIEDIYSSISHKWSNGYTSVLWGLKQLKEIRLIPAAIDNYGPLISKFFESGGAKGKWLECNIGQDKNLLQTLQSIQYNASIVFLGKCVPVIEKEMHDAGQLTYFDYLYYLRNMLKKDAEGEGKLIQYIYDRHSYFLIDEFQDTNPMQAEVFFYLSSEHPVGKWDECIPRPGSLFIVGDPKQSIYRFRNADVTSFLKVKKLFEDGVGDVLDLSRNFRSKECLCEYYNSVFSRMLPEETINQSKFEEIPLSEDHGDEFRGVFSYSMERKDDDAAWISEMVTKLVNNEQFKIRGKGEDDLRPIKYSDIMVITYAKSNLANIMQSFNEYRIPSKVEGEVLFEESEALVSIYRIYSAVVDTEDAIALYGALTGRIMALTKEELLVYRSCGGKLSLNCDFDVENCDNETAKKVASKLNELKTLQADSKNMSAVALMSCIMDRFKIFSIVVIRKIEVVYYALELVRDAEKTGTIVTLLDGKNYLENLLLGRSDVERCLRLNEDENCVHMANLHKVKGLEAPVIILALAQSGPINPSIRIQYNDDSVEGYIFELDKENKDEGYYFKTKDFEIEREAEKESLNAENARKIYVAATRARNALIICNFGKGRNRWKDLSPETLPDVFEELKYDAVSIDPNTGYEDADDLYEKAAKESVLNNRSIEKETYTVESPSKLSVVSKLSEDASSEETDEDDLELHRFASVIGTMIHKYMEIVVSSRNRINPEETIREIISEYRTARMAPYEEKITNALLDVAKTIATGGYAQTNGLPQNILKTLLNADEVYCEVPFCYKEDSPEGVVIWNGVMDVVYCSEGKWHIVDYKTNADGNDLDVKYQNQLAAYVKAFKETTGNDADAMTYHIDI